MHNSQEATKKQNPNHEEPKLRTYEGEGFVIVENDQSPPYPQTASDFTQGVKDDLHELAEEMQSICGKLANAAGNVFGVATVAATATAIEEKEVNALAQQIDEEKQPIRASLLSMFSAWLNKEEDDFEEIQHEAAVVTVGALAAEDLARRVAEKTEDQNQSAANRMRYRVSS